MLRVVFLSTGESLLGYFLKHSNHTCVLIVNLSGPRVIFMKLANHRYCKMKEAMLMGVNPNPPPLMLKNTMWDYLHKGLTQQLGNHPHVSIGIESLWHSIAVSRLARKRSQVGFLAPCRCSSYAFFSPLSIPSFFRFILYLPHQGLRLNTLYRKHHAARMENWRKIQFFECTVVKKSKGKERSWDLRICIL